MVLRKTSASNDFLLVLALAAVLSSCPAAHIRDYTNYKIYDVVATTEEQRTVLVELSRRDTQLDFFSLGRSLNSSSRILVPPTEVNAFLLNMDSHKMPYALLVDDVSLELAKQRLANTNVKLSGPNGISRSRRLNVFERYYRHDEINEHLELLALQYPSRVFVKTFGRSYERRPLKIVTVTNGDGRTNKKVIFIDAAIHAREWITPAMALHIIDELLQNSQDHAELLADYDWVLLPVVNADGYEYSHESDRYWRKTRQTNEGHPDCVGTDGNRNYAHGWGLDEGSSSNPCDETYRGAHAFSEPETRVVRDLMWHYKDRLKWYLSLHSYGNYVLIPWGYTSAIPDNFFDMMDIADAGAMAIVRATNTIYTYGNTYNVIYPTSGDSADYALGSVELPNAMVMELSPGGPSGFDPPVRQIEDFVTETWIGVKAMAEVVVRTY